MRSSRSLPLLAALLAVLCLAAPPARAQAAGPDVLIVTAHPDDDAMFAATVYAVTQQLGGAVDLALLTDGSGGFRYADLAEPIYGLDLTDEAVARRYLPAIRKQELMAGGRIVGIRNYFFFDAYDHQYTTDPDTVLQHVWDADDLRRRLADVMRRGDYDFVFAHLPVENFHGHHKAATILALEAAQAVGPEQRPVVLGSFVGAKEAAGASDMTAGFAGLPGYPVTRVREGAPVFVFDRTQPLSDDGRLTYQIVVDWLIAEHKSQGTMQLFLGGEGAELERFWFFDANDPARLAETEALFDRLRNAGPLR